MNRSTLIPVLCTLAISAAVTGCSGAPALSTSSIFGSGPSPTPTNTAAAAPAPPAPTSDPMARAFQVGTVSARAVKCGYQFDPAKLKASFLAAEVGRGLSADERTRVERIYDVSFNGVTKAVAPQTDYCTKQRTDEIKADLNRHLAGDFEPTVPKKVAQQQDGLFSGWFDNATNDKGLDIKPSTYDPF